MKILIVALLAMGCMSRVYYSEKFGLDWRLRWNEADSSNLGQFISSPGWWSVDNSDIGIQTSENAIAYAVSTKFPPFVPEGDTLVIQYTVKFEQILDCSGGYIKILGPNFAKSTFSSSTPYKIMFGPDFCSSKYLSHFIVYYDHRQYMVNEELPMVSDHLTHQYTIVIYSDNSFRYLIDNFERFSGNLTDSLGMPLGDGDSYLSSIGEIGGVGIEVHQTSPGTLFDNIFIGDNEDEALEFSKDTFLNKFLNEADALAKYEQHVEDLRAQSEYKPKGNF